MGEQLAEIAPWPARWGHSVAALSSGNILVTGGMGSKGRELNDVWRSESGGSNWTRLTEQASWPARIGHCSLPLTGGVVSCLLLGGQAQNKMLGDIWRSADGGATWSRVGDKLPWCARCWF